MNERDQAIGALAMVKPGTGEVMAISQSRPMGRDRKKGETFLNYVVDSKYGDSQGFQAGSTFKVFVLAAALEQGLPTSTRFSSPERISIPQNDFATCNGPYPVYAPWSLGNSTGSGTFDMITGTRQSVNTYFAQLERKTGLCEPYALAKAMGVDLTDPDRERVPSFVLGVAGVSPLEMASAYATFAARGKHCDTRPVAAILNSEGKVFKKYPKKCEQVMQESTADTVNQILAGVLAPGGFGQALALNKPSAGKTGTINSNMAVWFNGYTPTLSTAAMIAGANSQGQPDHPQRGHGRRPLHRRGLRVDGGRPHVGPGHAGDPGLPAVRVVLPAGAHRRRRCDPGGDPRRDRDVDAPGGPATGRGRLLREHRRPQPSDERDGRVAETSPPPGERPHAGRRSTSTRRQAEWLRPPARGVRRRPRRHRRPGPWSSESAHPSPGPSRACRPRARRARRRSA